MDHKKESPFRQEAAPLLKIFMLVFVPIIVVLMVVHYTIYQDKKNRLIKVLSEVEVHRASLLAAGMGEHFDWVFGDLNYLANRHLAVTMVKERADNGLSLLEPEFLLFSREKKIYDQIRVLDVLGQEQLRINYNDGAAYAVAPEKLQDKSLRYYVKQCLALEPGQIYVSPMDLNVENGEVEIPFKPIVRVGRLLYDEQGDKVGILLLNYYAANLLHHIRDQYLNSHYESVMTSVQPMFVNVQGYWLVAPNPDDEWGFMFKASQDLTFAKRYDQEWQQITSAETGKFLTGNGFFAFATVNSPLIRFGANGDFFGKIIFHVPADNLRAIIYQRKTALYSTGFLLVLLAATVSLLVAVQVARKKRFEQELQRSAFTDPLTGLLNRRAFQQRLEFEASRVDRYGGFLFMILGDIDHFKQVNDDYGHDAGDFILKKIAATLSANVRTTDVLCRWGGEEFMILVHGQEEQDGETVAEKLRMAVAEEIMWHNNPRLTITMSFGVCPYRKKMSLSALIKCSDDMLYAAKRAGRNRVVTAQVGHTS